MTVAQAPPVVATTRARHRRLATWLLWTLATTAGWCMGSLAVLLALKWTSGAADAFIRSVLGSALLGASVGVAIGLGQWLVLRREIHGCEPWIWVSTATWAAAWAVGQVATNALIEDYWLLGLVPGGLLLALTVSLGSWLALRPHVRHASAWLPAALIGWTLAGVVSMYGGGGLLGLALSSMMGLGGWLISAVPGALAGALTGLVLVQLLWSPARAR